MTRIPDHDLSVIVNSAAEGAVNARAAHHGGPTWDTLPAGDKNSVRELALPFIFHGTKALKELGYVKHREIVTVEELNDLPVGAVIRGKWLAEKWADEDGELWHVAGKGMRWDVEQLVGRGGLPAMVLTERLI
jgi:hypothetical protein